MEQHVTKYFLAWQERSLPEREQARIADHLDACEACRTYFDALGFAFDPARSDPVPRLEPDPYLPARIEALAAGGQRRTARIPILRISGAIISAAAAIVIGFFLGADLAPQLQQPGTANVYSSYYRVLSQRNFASTSWDSVLTAAREEKQ